MNNNKLDNVHDYTTDVNIILLSFTKDQLAKEKRSVTRKFSHSKNYCLKNKITISYKVIPLTLLEIIAKYGIPMNLIVSTIVGGVYEQNSIVNKCLCR